MKKYFFILFICVLALAEKSSGQMSVKGTVFDSSGNYPIQYVSVLTSRGGGAVSDVNGNYSVVVNETDSIWFSYLNKPTRRFAVKDIKTPYAFNISIQSYIPILPEARVRSRDYRQDSIQNRRDYAKIFDFQKPGLSVVSGNGSVGFDLDEIINAFRFKRNRSMQAFQNRLLNQEQENFIKYRFSKLLVRRITEEANDSILNRFMFIYQPSYLFTSRAADYAFHKYIKDSYIRFKNGLLPPPLWREGETEGY